ncbi:MAG TPA: glycosyltransferase family 4 protein [Kofleriaceae bacterium]|nr:glycosyltransferase family 4 protein [Kofleriaceae bacterium]
MSTLGLIASLERLGVSSCAVCHPAGTAEERRRLADAVRGEVVFTPLYWWNRKTRHPLLLRPLAEAKQALRTGCALRSTWEVKHAASRWGARLIHTNTIVTPEGGIAATQLGLPHVWHVRELIGPGKPFRFALEGSRFGDYVARHASKVIANSNATAALIADWLPPGLLEIVPNGIDLSRFSAVSSTGSSAVSSSGEDHARGRKLVVAMVAGLTARWKKHAVFVQAALRVDPSLPVEFRIYGHDPSHGGTRAGGPYIDGIHAMIAQAGAAARFRWPGHVADPVQVMSEIDILVHAADHESFGRVIVEAMAAGLPVVGANGGGVAEIVVDGTTGVLVPPDDPAAMARAIERLVRAPAERAVMGSAGRRRAEERYSLEACARGVLGVYEAAMARPLGPASAASFEMLLPLAMPRSLALGKDGARPDPR